MKLLDFQEKASEHIVEYFKEHNVYLLADETGLGKTVIASEVIQRLCKDSDGTIKKMNVLYIASNLELAKENVEKKLLFDDAEVVNGRLSLLWDTMKHTKVGEKPVKLFALTPEVSLKQSTSGTRAERDKCRKKYRKLLQNPEQLSTELLSGLREEIEKIEKCKELLKNVESDGGYTDLYREEKNKFGKYLSKELGETKIAYKNIKFSYDIDEDFRTMVFIITDMCLRKNVWNYMFYPGESSEIDEILQLDAVKSAAKEAAKNRFILQKYVDILWNGKKDVVDNNWNETPDEMIAAIVEKIDLDALVNEAENSTKIRRQIITLIKEKIYDKQYDKAIRTFMSFYSLEEIVKPDLVIIDEIQNYPEIFSEVEEVEDERSQIIKMVIDTVLGRGGQDENSKKVLMLSATPYAYRNMIESEADELTVDELDEFSKHLVGMNEILEYMKQRNKCNDDIAGLWKDCQSKMNAFAVGLEENLMFDNERYLKIVQALEELSKAMLKIGISRTERPLKSYKPTSGKYILDKFNINSLGGYYRKEKKACASRLTLSLPVSNIREWVEPYDVIKKGAEYVQIVPEKIQESARIDAFIKDIFEEDAYLYLFMPPNSPTRELQGVFAGKARSYGKTVLFSALNSVPPALKVTIDDEVNRRLFARINKSEAEFNKLVNEINTDYSIYIKQNSTERNTINGYFEEEKEREELCELFSEPHAKKVLLSIYGETLFVDYWSCVDQYCKDGNFEAVMDEFAYMRSLLKKRPSLSEFFYDADSKKNVRRRKNEEDTFCVMFTSKEGDYLEGKLTSFNSPFYPFIFMLTSVAEEGHDFHWYSDRIVHWNAPSTPIALMQREGRVDRCDCMAVRKEIAAKMENINASYRNESWEDMIANYIKYFSQDMDRGENVKYKDMFPRFITGPHANSILRMCYYYPFSGEYFRWEILMKNLEFYRSMFGACESVNMTEQLWESLSEEEKEKVSRLVLDIRVPK